MPCINHPDRTDTMFCNDCGVEICPDCAIPFQGHTLCYQCKERIVRNEQAGLASFAPSISGDQRFPSPWERRKEIGTFEAIKQTFGGVLFHPREFYSTLTYDGGMTQPILFALLVLGPLQMLVTAMGIFVGAVFGLSAAGSWSDAFGTGSQVLPMIPLYIIQIISAPVGLIAGILIGSGLAHLGLMIVGGPRRNFEASLRTYAFSNCVVIFMIVPIIGPLVGGIWAIVLNIIGLAEMHDTSYARSAFAVLYLVFLAFCCAILVMGLIGGGLALWGASV